MGRHFEVRAAAMAATAAKKSAIYNRASKEIYVAAKSGTPDPASNLALRSAIDKYRKVCPKDVIERAIKKAQGGDATNYLPGRYEAYGPGNSYLIIDTLADNATRAFTLVREVVNKFGHLGNVAYNFTYAGVFVFAGDEALRDTVEEGLILNDVDLTECTYEDGYIEAVVTPEAFGGAREQLKELGIEEFETAELRMIANETIQLEGEDLEKFKILLDRLDGVDDVQEVYHNVEL